MTELPNKPYLPSSYGSASTSTVTLNRNADDDDVEESAHSGILQRTGNKHTQEDDAEELAHHNFWNRTVNTAFGQLSLAKLFRPKYLKWHLLLLVLLVLTALMTIYHRQIITWTRPFATRMKELRGGWLIPIAILFIISFPPAFGHEVVALLTGLVWGTWVGFAIVAAGTLTGEIGNYFAFRYFLMGKAAKWEREQLNFACLVRVINEGGFRMILLARLSAIPAHLTTPLFAFSGMGFWTFFLATFLTLPKQLQVTYLGDIYDDEDSQRSTASKWISNSVLVLSFIVTIGAAWYIYASMAKWRPIIIRERSEEEAAKNVPDYLLPEHPTEHDMFAPHHAHHQEVLVSKRVPNYGSHENSPTLGSFPEFNESSDTINAPWPHPPGRHPNQPEYSPYDLDRRRSSDSISDSKHAGPAIRVQPPSTRTSMQSGYAASR